MALFQCFNPECSGSEHRGYIFEKRIPICPKCGSTIPDVATAVLVHLGYYSKEGEMRGYKGRKVRIACGTVQFSDPFNSISVNPSVVTCPKCVSSEAYKQMWMPNPNDPSSYYKDPNITEEEKFELMKGFETKGE